MEEELIMRRAEVESLRGYHQRVAPLANATNVRLWRMLPKLEKDDAELLSRLVNEAKYETSKD